MKINVKIILIFIFCILISSCHKFKNDPFITFGTLRNRAVGMWRVVYFEKDKADSTEYFNKYYLYHNIWILGKRHESDDSKFVLTANDSVSSDWATTQGYFEYNKIVMDGWLINDPNKTHDYKILKLFKDDWWLYIEYKGAKYRIKFKRIDVDLPSSPP